MYHGLLYWPPVVVYHSDNFTFRRRVLPDVNMDKLSEYLKLSEDEILVEIGRSAGLGASKSTNPIAAGRSLASAALSALQTSICTKLTKAIMEQDLLEIGAAIVPLIPQANEWAEPAALAALIVKRGVASLCKGTWENS